MNDYITKQLNKVLQLNKERHQVISKIRTTKTKKVGSHHLRITDQEKEYKVGKATKLYDTKVNAVYIKMNQELKKAGFEELESPYKNQNMKGDNENV